jgi:hypothetical protein
LLPPRRAWSGSRDTGRDRAWCTGKRARSRLARDGLSNPDSGARLPGHADGGGTRVRVQVLTNAGVLDRDKQLPVISQLTGIVAAAAGDPSLAGRTRALSTEAPDGGWGLAGHATTNAELAQGRRRDSGPPGPRTGN